MLNIDTKLKLNRETILSPNLCDRFTDEELANIGNWVWEGYDKDEQSRAAWKRRNESGMDLAMQVQKSKTFPWQNCSNVAFPLITIAAMQFHARAYSAILQGNQVVRYRVIGEDPSGECKARALRIGEHMSWQVLEEDEGWEDQHDRLLLNLAIVGCVFKKSYYSSALRRNVSEMVSAKDLVLNYWAKSLESCPRKTHIIPLSRNDIYTRVKKGQFRDVLEAGWFASLPPDSPVRDAAQAASDTRTGTSPPQPTDELTPFIALEQHCLIDLDKDGYAEPYIVTIEQSSRNVLRIITGCDRIEDVHLTPSGDVLSVDRMDYFTQYSFIPSPDGGIYDIGFGTLLGPLNESVNSIINQMIDAGTLSTTAGGFLSRGARIRGGPQTFSPFTWNRVDVSGEDLNKSMVPLPVREPSQTLFHLLTLLVNYTSRISGSTDVMTGENPGQNQPATTTNTVLEQGLQIYNSIFKRVWRSMKHEFQRLYVLNAINLSDTFHFGDKKVLRQDYMGPINWIAPAADPTITSDHQRLQQAAMLAERSAMVPGYDREAVERNLLQAGRVEGIAQLYPGIEKTGPLPNPKVQVEELKLKGKEIELKAQQMQFVEELQEEHRMNSAKILQLEAQAAKALADAGGVDMGHQLQAFQLALEAIKVHNEKVHNQVTNLLHSMEIGSNDRNNREQAAISRLAARPSNEGSSGDSPASGG